MPLVTALAWRPDFPTNDIDSNTIWQIGLRLKECLEAKLSGLLDSITVATRQFTL